MYTKSAGEMSSAGASERKSCGAEFLHVEVVGCIVMDSDDLLLAKNLTVQFAASLCEHSMTTLDDTRARVRRSDRRVLPYRPPTVINLT